MDEAIREAVLDLVAELGYERVSIEAVAQRARTAKTTVYRRWESKAQMVMEALGHLTFVGPTPNTGSLRGDLAQLCRDFTDEPGGRALAVMQGLASALPHDRDLSAAFNEYFVAPRRAAMAEMFARAVERGEMPPGKDVDLLTSVIPALMMHRLSTVGEMPSPAFASRIAAELLLPAATAPSEVPRGV